MSCMDSNMFFCSLFLFGRKQTRLELNQTLAKKKKENLKQKLWWGTSTLFLICLLEYKFIRRSLISWFPNSILPLRSYLYWLFLMHPHLKLKWVKNMTFHNKKIEAVLMPNPDLVAFKGRKQLIAVVLYFWETKSCSLTCMSHAQLWFELEFGFLKTILPLIVGSLDARSRATEREFGATTIWFH